MKKNLTKPHLFTSTIITVLLLLTIGFTSCEKETTPDNKYTDAEYLDLEFYNKNRMTDKDYEKIFEASARFEAKRVNGLYQLREITPEELNISPKLFKHVTYIFNYTNRSSNSMFIKTTKRIVRLKSGDPEDQESDDTYCVSHCVSSLSFWTSLSKAKKHQDSKDWSNGVPPEKVKEFIKHFLPDYKQGSTVGDLIGNTPRKSILTYAIEQADGSLKGHAALLLSYNTDMNMALVEDANTGNSSLVSLDKIMNVYSK